MLHVRTCGKRSAVAIQDSFGMSSPVKVKSTKRRPDGIHPPWSLEGLALFDPLAGFGDRPDYSAILSRRSGAPSAAAAMAIHRD